MRRRALLASLGGTIATLSTGCLSDIEERLTPSAQLGWFGAHNFDTEPHLFDLQVIRDGTQVHRSSHEIQSRDGNYIHNGVAECSWGSASGDYTVPARVDGDDWIEESITEFVASKDADCALANVEYHNNEGLRFVLWDGCNRDWDNMCGFTTR